MKSYEHKNGLLAEHQMMSNLGQMKFQRINNEKKTVTLHWKSEYRKNIQNEMKKRGRGCTIP